LPIGSLVFNIMRVGSRSFRCLAPLPLTAKTPSHDNAFARLDAGSDGSTRRAALFVHHPTSDAPDACNLRQERLIADGKVERHTKLREIADTRGSIGTSRPDSCSPFAEETTEL
jgi:hypothetical protein